MTLSYDDLMSMHRATEDVIARTAVAIDTQGFPSLVDAALASLRESVTALAVVQRDLLAATLGG